MATNDRYISIGMGLDIQDLRTGLSDAKREMTLAESEFKATTAGLDKWDESIEGVTAKLKQMATEMQAKEKIVQAYRAELERVTTAYGANSKQAQEVQTKLNNAEASYTKAQKYTETLKQKLNDLKTAENGAMTASDSLKGSITGMGSASETASTNIKSKLADALNKVKDSAEKAGKDGFDQLKSKVTGFVTGALSKATNALKDFIKQTVQLGIDFSSTMSTVQALSGASAEEMAVMEKAARDAGASTTFSAVEAAEALKYMSLAGWDATQSTEALGGILDLAASSGMGLAEASDAVTDYLTAFGLEAKDSAHFADMLAYAQANANLSADQLIASYKNASSTLSSAGQSVETVTALLAVLSNSGLKGSEAGTALSAVMRDITKRMEDGAVQIGNATVKVADQEGNFRSLTDILGDVAGAVDGLGTAERSQALSATFTADSIKAVNTILNAGVNEVGKYEEALGSADGTAKEMAKTMNDNLGGDIKQLNSVLDEIKLALFDLIEGPLRAITQALTELLKHSGTVTDGVAKGFGNVTTKFEGASKGIDALVNADWDGIGRGAQEAWDGMAGAFAGVGQWAEGVFDKIKNVFKDPAKTLQSIGGSLYTSFTSVWDSASSWAGSVLEKVKGALSDPLGTIKGASTSLYTSFTSVWNTASSWAGGVLKAIKGAFDDPLATLKGASTSLYNKFTSAWDSASSWAGGVLKAIKGAFDDPLGTIKNVATGLYNKFKSAWDSASSWAGGIFNTIKNAFNDPLGTIKDVSTSLYNKFTSAWNTASSWAGGVFNTIKNAFNDPLSTLKGASEGLFGKFKSAWDSASSWAGGVFNTIKNAFNDPLSTLKGASEGLFGKFKSAWDSASSWAGGVFNTIKNSFNDPLNTIKGVSSSLYTKFTSAWNTASSWAGGIFNTIKNAFNDPLGTIKGVSTSLYNKFKSAWDSASSWAGGIFNTIKNAFNDPLNTLKGVSTSLYNKFKSAWDSASSWAGGIFNTIKNAFNDPLNTIKNVATGLYNKFKSAWDSASSWAGGVFNTIKNAFNDPLNTLKAKGEGLWNGLKSGFTNVQSWFTTNVVSPIKNAFTGMDTWATNTFGGVWSAIKSPFEGIYNWFKTNVVDKVVEVFKPILNFFGIETDAKVDPLAGMRAQIATSEAEVKRLKSIYDSAYATYQSRRSTYGYSNALTTEAQRASNSAYTAWNTARQELQRLQTALETAEREQESGSDGIGGIKTSITNAFSGIENVITKPFTDAWNTITGTFSGIGDWFSKNVVQPIQNALKPVGQAVSSGVVGGMTNAKQSITTGTQTLGGWIFGGLCDVLGIHSPSKLMHDKVGLMVGAGIALGIEDSTREAVRATEGLGRAVSDGLRLTSTVGSPSAGRAVPNTVVYNQTINSPDPLSAGQIYRDTRSLIGRRQWA